MDSRHIRIFDRKSFFRGRQWFFTIIADNGEPIAQSEGYKSLNSLLDTTDKYFPNWEIR